jgi:plastocyanin
VTKLALLALNLLFWSLGAHAQAIPTVANCAPEMYVDDAGPTAQVPTRGSSYVPRCLRVKRGTSVTIGASSHHPLQGIVMADGSINPIFDEFGGAVSPKTVTFNETGIFGFYCIAHSDDLGSGMGGAIWVVD